ncbi:MAG: 6-phosphogluconolactonase [Pseudomonadota bacterium]
MNVIEYPDREFMIIELAASIAATLEANLNIHEEISLAVPGGGTPGPLFDDLCGAEIEWDRVTVMVGDERWVPEDSPRSNAALIRRRLLQDKAATAKFISFYREDMTPDEAMAPLSEKVAPHLPLSVLLLGMGADMHTASLFPGADRLEEALSTEAPALMALRADGAQEPRITLTAPVLTGALETHILITGTEKRDALEKAARLNDPMAAPVSLVLSQATIHWAE